MDKNRSHTLITPPKTLPPHIIVQILYRTPVKSLVRFRCVSRTWYTLISHPKFINNHLHFNTTLNNHIILNATVRNSNNTLPCLLRITEPRIPLVCMDRTRKSDKSGYCRYDIGFNKFKKDMVLVGCINGIVCLSHDKELFGYCVALWNPAVECWKLIALQGLRTVYDKCESMSVGFGCDVMADDYKVIVIIPVVIPPEFKERRWSRVDIYSVKRDFWKCVMGEQGISIPFWPKFPNCNFIVNGVPYWAGFDECPEDMAGFDTYTQEILGAFDPHTGIYKKVPYPAFVKNEGTCVHPVKYRDLVAALIQSPGPCPNSMVDLYVLDENSSDWTKIYTIGPFSFKNMRIPQCCNTGELVVETWEKNEMDDWDQISYYCDPETNCVFPAGEFDTLIPLWSQSYTYVESLVCVKGMQPIGHEDKIKKVQPRKKTWAISLPDDFEAVLHL